MEKPNTFKVVSAAFLNALPPYLKGELPAIKLTKSMYKNGLNQRKFSLIGRLDLSKIKFEEARDQLFNQWKTEGEVKLIPIGKGFFLIKLENANDKIQIWSSRWSSTQSEDWEPRFNPEKHRTSLAKVWIKYMGLLLEYWTEENLLAMAKAFGKPIQVDTTQFNYVFWFLC